MKTKTLAITALMCLAFPALADGWIEDGDAGPLRESAQHTLGDGPLDDILGHLTPTDMEDMYCITITDVANFSCSTGATAFDTQLFLFDIDGMGITFNDDDHRFGTGEGSAISGQFVPGPGAYFLAISCFDRDAVSDLGEIWDDFPFEGERAPDGPGAGLPISGWNVSGTEGQAYELLLTGAGFCEVPEPGPFICLGFGLLAFSGSRLRRRRFRSPQPSKLES